MKNILILFICLCLISQSLQAQEQPVLLKGKILSKEDAKPLPGALAALGKSNQIAITDELGAFTMEAIPGSYELTVSYLGMMTHAVLVTLPLEEDLVIFLLPDSRQLQEVTVMSTGYQNLPVERVTGSFAAMDKELISRSVSTNFLDRLENVVSGVIFNKGPGTGGEKLSIRGRSTLFANAEPLIVLDNFPYDGSLESINPNDIEQITVLKDAAAASIWGARAGNGVIVITTFKGSRQSAPKVSFNSSINYFQQPDLYYVPQMKMEDYIDIERQLFQKNYYRSQEISSNKTALSPVVETLIARRDGRVSESEAEAQLELYKGTDLRRELAHYYYRPRLNQQYALAVSGGSDHSNYLLSMGYDRNLHNINGNGDDRWTFQVKNSWSFFKDKLTWSLGAYLTKSADIITTEVPSTAAYGSLSGEDGSPLPIYTNLSERYINSLYGLPLLDWHNVPLNELGQLDKRFDKLDGRFQTSMDFELIKDLKIGVSYQYWGYRGRERNRSPKASYYVRDLVNRFTTIGKDGLVSRPLPDGDILDLSETFSFSHTVRSQLTYQKFWSEKHRLSFLAGMEIRDLKQESNSMRYYGYDDNLGVSAAVDFISRFPYFYNPNSSRAIDPRTGHGGATDRFVSYYSNLGYTYANKWDATFSIRKDQSNFFGVESNQRGVPLWSAGLGWTLSEEPFSSFLNGAYLKWRGSYGYSGNLDKRLSGLLTAAYFTQPSYAFIPNIPGAYIQNAPNPALRWEKVGIWNTGLDFESTSGKYSASLEFYGKRGQDLISQFDVPASTGFTSVTGNFATTQTTGLDVVVGVNWLKGTLKWKTDLLYSHIRDEVIQVDVTQSASSLVTSGFSALPAPIEGQPFFGIYSFPWAGLNPDNGNPMGFLDGEPSENYGAIISSLSPDDLVFHGSARPTDFGSLRNSLSWKGFSLSVNISYRLGYYYRRRSIDYNTLLRGQQIGHGDFDKRWKATGDELLTDVPSMPASANSIRNSFYMYSEPLVERGDHIRLQDIRFSYSLGKKEKNKLPFSRAEFYTYANNLGVIWKASDDKLDPDYQAVAPRTSIAMGIKMNF